MNANRQELETAASPAAFILRLPFLAGLVLLALVLPPAIVAGPNPLWRSPGKWEGMMKGRWIAPFVHYTDFAIGDRREGSVSWYQDDGTVAKVLSGRHVRYISQFHNGAGYVENVLDEGRVVYALDGSWQVKLLREPRTYIPVNARENLWAASRDLFLRQYDSGPNQTSIDVYRRGAFLSSVGPFFDHRDSDAQIGEGGYSALMTWKEPEQTTPQVVVISPEGKIVLREDCQQNTGFPLAVARGKGVVLAVESPPVS